VNDPAFARKARAAASLTEPFRYDVGTVFLHWSTAFLVACLWVVAQIIDYFPPGPLRVDARSAHILLGVILAIILAMRVAWRSNGTGAISPVRTGFVEQMASLGHKALYALLVLAVLTGMVNAWVRGDSILNLFAIPSISPGNRELRGIVGAIHAFATNTLLIVALLHSVVALFHHYVLRDDVLGRMLRMPAKAGPVAANRDSP
jgi:cytochrome b561